MNPPPSELTETLIGLFPLWSCSLPDELVYLQTKTLSLPEACAEAAVATSTTPLDMTSVPAIASAVASPLRFPRTRRFSGVFPTLIPPLVQAPLAWTARLPRQGGVRPIAPTRQFRMIAT